MFTSEQKKEMVEQGLKEFSINPKFRQMISWLCEEFDKAYDAKCKKCNLVGVRYIRKGKPTKLS